MSGDDAELIKAGVEGFTAAALEPLSELIRSLFGSAASEAGLLLQDEVKYVRFKRRIRLFQRTKELLEQAHIDAKQVPLKLLAPIIENASIEDEDDLQDRWANLLANAADPRKIDSVVASFPAILKEFTSRDAKLLDGLFMAACEKRLRGPKSWGVESVKFSDEDLLRIYSSVGLASYPTNGILSVAESERPDVKADLRGVDFSMDLFARHGVVVKVFEVPVRSGTRRTYTLGTSYSFTHLGHCFVRACREPTPTLA